MTGAGDSGRRAEGRGYLKTVVAYISGHGLGHAARALGVCGALPPEVRLIVRSPSPEWFWRGELQRPFEWAPEAFDVGAVQIDNLRSDGLATLRAAAEVELLNSRREDGELRWLSQVGADAVLCDIPPFPLTLAARLGIPAVLVANFTWVDIYRPYLAEIPSADERRRLAACVDRLAEAYRCATLVLRTPLSMDLAELDPAVVRDIPLIVRPARRVKDELRQALGIPPTSRLVLLSTGLYGLELDVAALARIPHTRFVSFGEVADASDHLISLRFPRWHTQDVTASVDAVIAKAGYGTIAECMAAGTPLVHPPRDSFAEHAALVRGMAGWGGGLQVSEAAFRGLDLAEALDEAIGRRPLPAVEIDGAAQVVAALQGLIGAGDQGSETSHRKG